MTVRTHLRTELSRLARLLLLLGVGVAPGGVFLWRFAGADGA